ncbi:hemicentin-2-like [Xyrauchen texanus]|uniref:hemicentin-2-like n=1 Tax=Xyrauchen texanus TaxID=154827 RepID=UPI0022419A8E|nr:hemicentin-2-like [Xyrauchen texanus]
MQKRALFLTTTFRIFERRKKTFEATLFRCFRSFLYFYLLSLVAAECPVQFNPPRLVVKYNSPVSVNCSATVTHEGMGWERAEGVVSTINDSLVTWNVQNLRLWEKDVFCFINYDNGKQCSSPLPITIYKTPDSVSISTVDHTGPMIEGEHYKLQCDIQDVAPVKSLRVKWFKGETQLNLTTFSDTTKTPVSESATLLITANKADDGVQYRCEAELELGPDGPQTPPTVTSEPLNITVHYKPIINEIKLPYKVYVSRGYPLVLVCEADGHPNPTISWNHTNNSGGNLTIPEATYETNGIYYCNASNTVDSIIRNVTVVVQDISIKIVNHTGPMIWGEQYKLQCDIQDVGPVKSLRVKWFKGETQVNLITFSDTTKTPVNESATLLITANTADDGVQYRCEAELELVAEGPQPPIGKSKPLNITVHVKPIINETKLAPKVPVFRGYITVLVCEAEGYPKPTISWGPNPNVKADGGNLTITEKTPENIYCIANNSAGSTTRYVTLVFKEDHLPLIAGLVAITVAFISVIFIFIYSIYYKKAKMGQYILKDAKPSAQNGNIAQNGKDNTIPMKKLSQSNIPTMQKRQDALFEAMYTIAVKRSGSRLAMLAVTRLILCLPLALSGFSHSTRLVFGSLPFEYIGCCFNLSGVLFAEPHTVSCPVDKMLLCLLGLVYLSAVVQMNSDAECPVQFNPPRLVVKYNSPVSVNCSATVTHEGMGWERAEGVVSTINDSLVTWNVQNLRLWEKGVFCYINYDNGKQCTSRLPITMYKTPDSVSISTVDHTGPMIEGEHYKLQCDIQDVAPVKSLRVKWFKGETQLNRTTFSDTTKTPVSESATLLITANKADDGVQYRCEAELELGPDGPQTPPTVTSKPLDITVHYKPKHSSSVEIISTNSNEVSLDCTVVANPAPTYTWHSEHLQEKKTSSVLPSSTLTPGNYTCTATNYLGESSKVFIIESTDAECPVQLNPPRLVVKYNSPVSVNCSATVTHDGMGWEKFEGEESTINDSLVTWNVQNLRQWEKGVFCYINYDNGEQCTSILPITIYKTPDSVSISTVDHTGPMIEGEHYKLQCDIQDVAPVKSLRVKWFKGETLLNLTTFNDTTETPVSESATLLITANKADDGVQYRCEAELELGPDGPQSPPTVTSKPLDITVHYKPKHSSSVEIISTNSNEVSLDCTVVANPAPTYTWHSKHLQEKKTSSVLPSSTLTPGNYTCTATNYLGESSKVFIIESTGEHHKVHRVPFLAGYTLFKDPKAVAEHRRSLHALANATIPGIYLPKHQHKERETIQWSIS